MPRLRRLCGSESQSSAPCPTLAPRARRRCSSAASAARAAFLIIWRATASTRSTAARPRSRRASSSPTPSSTCGSSPATETRSASAATTRCTCCAATSTARSCCSTTKSTASRKANIRRLAESARAAPRRRSARSIAPSHPARSRSAPALRFIARGIDVHKNLPDVLKAAHAHRGASFVEIFQNCIVYNDDVFACFTEKQIAHQKATLAPRPARR